MNKGKILLLKHFGSREEIKKTNKESDFFWIGRKNKQWKLGSSAIANPFGVSKDCSREQSAKSYKSWLFRKIKSVDQKVVSALYSIITSKRPIIICENKEDAQIIVNACKWLEKLATVQYK